MVLLAALASLAASTATAAPCRTSQTTLDFGSGSGPVFDGAAGHDTVLLRANGKVRATISLEGQWRCLGFVAATGRYLLLGSFQVGAWLPAKAIKYVDEATGKVTESALSATDWMALGVLASPQLRYVAFVGSRQNGPMKLEVLDTATDQLRELGATPAPPPAPDAVADPAELDPWQWGSYGSDALVELDPATSLVRFTGDTLLSASYGKDTFQKRATKRTERTWSLPRVFAAGVPSKSRP